MRFFLGENLPNQIDVLAQGIDQISKTERHVQQAGFFIKCVETVTVFIQLGNVEMMIEVVLQEFQLAIAAEYLAPIGTSSTIRRSTSTASQNGR